MKGGRSSGSGARPSRSKFCTSQDALEFEASDIGRTTDVFNNNMDSRSSPATGVSGNQFDSMCPSNRPETFEPVGPCRKPIKPTGSDAGVPVGVRQTMVLAAAVFLQSICSRLSIRGPV